MISFSIHNRALVLLCTLGFILWGVHALARTPIDAIPDLSEHQVIVFADWPGRSPREVEDQVTYPLSVNLQGLAGVKAVRSTSELGYSMVAVIFEDDVDPYFARARILERLSTLGASFPDGVAPYLAPDATALGQVYAYVLESEPGSGQDLGSLRALQDWTVRYQLQAVPGVAQVASVGGFIQEWQVDVDPLRLRAHGLTLGELFEAVARGSGAVGGDVLVAGRAESVIRGVGWLRDRGDLESIVVAVREGQPVLMRHVATVALGPAPRRAVLEQGGGEAVGGIVIMRSGEDPAAVIERVEARIAELSPGLPAGVRVAPFYDRRPLIRAATSTLVRTLLEEAFVASLMVLLVLRHARSAFVICVSLPLAVLAAFLLLRPLGVTSNIMSLSGIAISIGVLLDAGIVMTENAHTKLRERFGDEPITGDTRPIVLEACLGVGRPLFFAVLIMLVSFLPVFALEGIEGRMFRPLALTKTFALAAVAVLGVTVVPALLPTFLRGRLRGEEASWLVRSVADVYRPALTWLIDRPRVVLLSFALLVGIGLNLVPRLGSEFMPPLDEGTVLDMPVTVPRASVVQVRDDLVARDELLRQLPEVELVTGKAGRADTPFDPSPIDMVETVVNLRPREHRARRAVDFDVLLAVARAASPQGADAEALAMGAQLAFDRAARELVRRRQDERATDLGRELASALVRDLLTRAPGATAGVRDASAFERSVEQAVAAAAPALARGPQPWDVAALVRAVQAGLESTLPPGTAPPRLGAREASALEPVLRAGRELLDRPEPTVERELLEATLARRDAALRDLARRTSWELEDRAPALVAAAVSEAAREAGVTLAAAPAPPARLHLRESTKDELITELDGLAHVPGWGNIWTQPIINRVDMLATGVRTLVGVKVSGDDLGHIQAAADRIATALRAVPGAVDVFPDQVVGERYLEVEVDRERAARWGVSVEDVNDTIEVALGGRPVTTTIDGRRRWSVRVRYARDARQDEDLVRRVLVVGRAAAGEAGEAGDAGSGDAPGAGPETLLQVPLSEVATIRAVEGPSMIKSEDGRLRAFVQLNVRGRDLASFVEEARGVVDALPLEEVTIGWSGQFEHEARARARLARIVPLVVLLIFVILWLTYADLGDALLMMLAIPGALVGGVIFQWLLGVHFSVAVWVGYIACFGLAAETGIIMLVYLREALERRGGLARIASLDDLRAAVVEGAVHRLRPKLLTEGTAILGLVPMLVAEGVGAEVMRPMAAPVLGGLLLADEVIDVFIPALFFQYRKARWERLRDTGALLPPAASAPAPATTQTSTELTSAEPGEPARSAESTAFTPPAGTAGTSDGGAS